MATFEGKAYVVTGGASGIGEATTRALVAAGFLGIWGIYAIWETALGPLPIEKPTARGLAAGIVSMVIMIWALMSVSSDEGGSIGVPGLIPLWLAFGPIARFQQHAFRPALGHKGTINFFRVGRSREDLLQNRHDRTDIGRWTRCRDHPPFRVFRRVPGE